MIGSPRRLRVRRNFPRLPGSVFAAVADASASFIADAVEGRGVLDYRIKPLLPEWRVVGNVVTAFVGAGDNLAAVAALDLLEPGDVLLIGTGGSCAGAVLGDNMGLVAQRHGAAAIVTDGALRDADALIDLGLPCFCAGLTPGSAGSRGPGEVGLPMAMGTVTVASGDLLIGDRDGVIVVPYAEVPAMLENLAAVRDKETALNTMLSGKEAPSLLRRRYPEIDAETVFVD